MFAKTIIDSDAFLDMPMSARLLYYDLGMRADDDGFINSPKKIMRTIGSTPDDMNILIARKFVIPFESGVVVIKAWRINNYLRSDRYKETTYLDEKSALEVDKNGMYHSKDINGIPLGIPVVDAGKDSIGKDSINISSKDDMSVSDEKDAVVSDTKSLKTEIETVIKAWNNTTFKPVSRLGSTTNRYIWLQTRLREYGLDAVLEAINNAEESKYLHSEKATWFNFEWFIRPNNFPKVLERNYNEDAKKPEVKNEDRYANYQDA